MNGERVTIFGAFLIDLACRTQRMPNWGETLHGKSFIMGPGGKGSNQAVAAARQGATIELITRVGRDAFGDMAYELYAAEGIGTRGVLKDTEESTGTATIIVDDARSENAIIIVPGACGGLSIADVDGASDMIADSAFFVSQLELPTEVCLHAIDLAYRSGVSVVLNPAPAMSVPRAVFQHVDYLTPNETEAGILTGRAVDNTDDAKSAAHTLRDWGVRNVLVTMGKQGVYVCGDNYEGQVPACSAGPSVDTTGAGDAFNGGLVAALVEGQPLRAATRFGCAVAGLSVTRAGTAPAMPTRDEVDRLLEANDDPHEET